MRKKIMIFGAGKIGRGFLGHLFYRSGYALTFVEASPAVVDQLSQTKKYSLLVLGAAEKNQVVEVTGVLSTQARAQVVAAMVEHDLFATAVGGTNLQSVGQLLAEGFQARLASGNRAPADVIICENYQNPASILRETILQHTPEATARAWVVQQLGLVETQVLRSCIEPDQAQRKVDPLAVQVQDWWVLPCDAEAFRNQIPECEGLRPKANFQYELLRKLYTYNGSNATIAYLGYLKGHHMLAEAANDPHILQVARAAGAETSAGLVAAYGMDAQEQEDLLNLALQKYRDATIPDPIERNGRDTRRKLSATDRLLGPATLASQHGIKPDALALAVAAGFHYSGSQDDGTRYVSHYLREHGLRAAITHICGLAAEAPLTNLIVQRAAELAAFNQRGITLVTQ